MNIHAFMTEDETLNNFISNDKSLIRNKKYI